MTCEVSTRCGGLALVDPPEKGHHFATLELLPPYAGNSDSGPAWSTNPDDMTDPKAVAGDVERLLARWLEIEYFGMGSVAGRIDAGRAVRLEGAPRRDPRPVPLINGVRMTSVLHGLPVDTVGSTGGRGGSPVAATDGAPQLWRSTIARKLHRIGREYEAALVDAAENRFHSRDFRQTARRYAALLGSPSQRKRFNQTQREIIENARWLAAVAADLYLGETWKITRSRRYGEAVLLFWWEITATPTIAAHCLGPLDENHRWN